VTAVPLAELALPTRYYRRPPNSTTRKRSTGAASQSLVLLAGLFFYVIRLAKGAALENAGSRFLAGVAVENGI
jgi:hypothetical protein